jgi:hypothetical protein
VNCAGEPDKGKVSLDNLLESYRDIAWAQDNILIAVSANADGTSGVKEAADATLREEIEKAGHLMFASSAKQRDFWLGRGKASPAELLERYGGLKPCIWGCDAHEFARVGKPDEDRFCWIKGVPAFDTLRQAVIDPERAYVGAEPPTPAAASQIIDRIAIENAPWAQTPVIHLNPGLVAVIGARGSGKTALVDMIAAGCDSYQHSERPSFLARAAEHLAGAAVTLTWKAGDPATCPLDAPVNDWPDAYPRARYLSQQFVEELCSIEGKRRRQVIIVTHNANLVINTDADEIIVAEVGTASAGGLPPIRYQSGGLDEKPIRTLVCNILEGGELAFRDRARRLRIGLKR